MASVTAQPIPGREVQYTRPPMAAYQMNAIFCPQRYGIIEASTKAGKTAGCLVWLLEQALAGQVNWNYWWVAPVYAQAKIAFRRMKRGIPKYWYRANESELTITLANGAVIWFKSGEKPDNLYGEDVHAAVVDEASRVKEESWHALRSTLTATRGRVRVIGNVKGRKNWAYKMARRAESGHKEMHYARITAVDAIKAGIIKQAEVDDAREQLPKSVFEELYMAIASDADGRVYSSFQFAYNVNSDVHDLGGTVHIGMDFNVNPMTCTIGSIAEKDEDKFVKGKHRELHEWSEIVQANSNTERMAKTLRAFLGEKRRAIVYPDPHVGRGTNAPLGLTDHHILRQHGFEVVTPQIVPIPVVDRVNEVNAMLCTSSGLRRTYVNPAKCPSLVEGLDSLMWSEKGSGIDKTQGYDHITDGHGYKVHSTFPLPTHTASTQSLRR